MKYLKKGFILMVIGLLFLACGSENNPTRPRKTVQKPLPAIELTLKNYKKIALSKKYSLCRQTHLITINLGRVGVFRG